jgi:hypothetical protein
LSVGVPGTRLSTGQEGFGSLGAQDMLPEITPIGALSSEGWGIGWLWEQVPNDQCSNERPSRGGLPTCFSNHIYSTHSWSFSSSLLFATIKSHLHIPGDNSQVMLNKLTFCCHLCLKDTKQTLPICHFPLPAHVPRADARMAAHSAELTDA